jgi:NADPH:quinone reductase-like Zn-dependent oxidoreductase
VTAVNSQTGDPAEVVRLVDAAEPGSPRPGQVVIRVTLIPIHWADVQPIRYDAPTEPTVPVGVEATGIIESVGEGGEGLQKDAVQCRFPARSVGQADHRS